MTARRYEPGSVTLRDVWRVVRESALKRLGRELLWVYFFYFVFTALGVLACVVWMFVM